MAESEDGNEGPDTLADAVARHSEGPGLPTYGYVPNPAEIEEWTDLSDYDVERYYQFRQAREAQRHRMQQEAEFDLAIVLLLAAAIYYVADELGWF